MAKRTLSNARTISVATPEELDKLLEWLREAAPTAPARHEGEHLFAHERLVVSPGAGIFVPAAGVVDGIEIEVGTVLELHGQRRLLDVYDPDGNRIQLAEELSRG